MANLSPDESWLLKDWAKEWLRLSVHLKPRSRSTYESVLRNWILPHLGEVALRSITPLAVRRWVATMQGEGAGTERVRYAHRVLAQVLGAAVDCDLIERTPCRGVRLPRSQKREMAFLSPAELEGLVEATLPHYRMLVALLGYTGLRWGEATALRRRCIDLDEGRIRVQESLAEVNGHLYFGETKTHTAREIVAAPFLIKRLREHLVTVDRSEDALVFTTQTGMPVRNCNFHRHVWRPALAKAGLPETLRIHDLRHTCASMLIASGVNIKAIQRQLGHATATMTLDRYGHLSASTLDEVGASLESIHIAASERRGWSPQSEVR